MERHLCLQDAHERADPAALSDEEDAKICAPCAEGWVADLHPAAKGQAHSRAQARLRRGHVTLRRRVRRPCRALGGARASA